MIISSGNPINSVEEWFTLSPPKEGAKQWKDGRSAKELAKAFFLNGSAAEPPELVDLLESSSELGKLQLTHGWPECKIKLDSYRGETRNADLAAIGIGKPGVVAVTVEAKADESFGETIKKSLAAASPRSNLPKRIEALAQALFGRSASELGTLRYQLLHGTAATLIFAEQQSAKAAAFVVLELKSSLCSAENLERNAQDLEAFVHALSPSASLPGPGQLVGPFKLPGGGLVPANLPLFIGKAIRAVA